MELSQLVYFRTTAKAEHFTRAAEELHITQPSLSKSIANLEQELGIPLFDREGKRVHLNVYGQAFLEKVEQILALTDEAAFMLRDMAQGERGQVRIGSSFPITPPSPVYYYQYSFFQSRPHVALALYVRAGEQIESLLEERELDFGISQSPAQRLGTTSQPLYTDKLGVIVGPEHPLANAGSVSLSALAGEQFLCNTAGPDPNDSARYLCALAGFSPDIIYEGESSELIGESVAMGRGISFVSQARYETFQRRSAAPEWERELHYVDLSDPFCTRTIYLLYRASGYRTQAAQWFYEGLMKYLEQ
jgi:DNA-binding transcriptional LysR family regulator